MKRILHLTVLICILCFICTAVKAQQPELSYWTKNISEGQGASIPGFQDFAHELVVSGNTVHTIWIADSAYFYKLFYRRSADNGNTWEEKVLLAGGVYPYFPTAFTSKRLTVEGNNVHIAYTLHREDVNMSDVYYIRSLNGGASFEEPRVIFNANRLTDRLFITSSGTGLTIGIQDWSEQQADFYFLNSTDGGSNFSISEYGYTQEATWGMEDLVRDGDDAYALILNTSWYNGLVYGNLYFLAFYDEGASVKSTRISVPSAENHLTYPLQYVDDYGPKTAIAGSHVYVIWPAVDADLEFNLLLRHSADGGNSWDDVVNLTKDYFTGTEIPLSGMQTVHAAENFVYVLFQTNANRIYTMSSSDHGQSFSDIQELTAPQMPYIASGAWAQGTADRSDASGQTFHVVWAPGGYVKTTDGGNTYTKPVSIATRFSWYNDLVYRVRLFSGNGGALHFAVQGRYVYAYDDIFYQRIDPIPGHQGAAALKLNYVYGGDRLDNMAVASSASLHFTDELTVEAWINPEAGSPKSAHILSKQDNTTYVYSPSAYQLATHGERLVSAGITTTSGISNMYSQRSVPEGSWTHIAMTYDKDAGNDNFRIYVNGTLDQTASVTGEMVVGDGVLFIGTPNRDTYGFNGMVDEVRLWNRARTELEIQQEMYRSLQGNEPGLAAYYDFSHTTLDGSGNGNDGYLMYREEFVTAPITAPDTDSDGIPDPEEWGFDEGDPGFDGNADGIVDWMQSNAASLKTFSQTNYVTLATVSDTRELIPLVDVEPVAVPAGQPAGYAFPYDMVQFSLHFPAGLSSADVNFFVQGSADYDTYVNYGRPSTEATEDVFYDFKLQNNTGATLNQGSVNLRFIDGQRGDHDLAANGSMITMGGPALAPQGVQTVSSTGNLKVFPNPVHQILEMTLVTPVSKNTIIELYNIEGQKVKVLYNDKSMAGENHFRFPIDRITPGIYTIRVLTDGAIASAKVVVIK
ncbi:MAG TPA: T9SS type A sorting domain-containing protein [Bacteroidales bacterium]|nr:T9SS type A sorting domain-containing protein [Bacteroidales bacterium]HNS45606.1 T9SS type A sorting domain-containing protein [Bacteroidales bacterium]